MPSKTWQFLMLWPFSMSSHSAKPEHLDFGVRRCSRRELIQGTRVPLCEKGDFLIARRIPIVRGNDSAEWVIALQKKALSSRDS